MHMNPALQLFGAGRERRIYAIPPYTKVTQSRLRRSSVRGAEVGACVRAVRIARKLPRRNDRRRCGQAHVRLLRQRLLPRARAATGLNRQRTTPRMNPHDAAAERPRAHETVTAAAAVAAMSSFDLYPGEVLCIVGESGSGKIHAAECARVAQRGRQRRAPLHRARMAKRLDLLALSEAAPASAVAHRVGLRASESRATACAAAYRRARISASR